MNKATDEEVFALDQPTSSQLVERIMAIMAEANVTLIDLLEGLEIERYGETGIFSTHLPDDQENLQMDRLWEEIYRALQKDPLIFESWNAAPRQLGNKELSGD